MMRSIFFILCAVYISACSTVDHVRLYSGPKLPQTEEVTVQLPEHFDAIEFDGYAIPQTSLKFRTGDMPLVIPPGEHKLIIQYHDIWNLDDENHEAVTSGHIVFRFTAKAGETYRLIHDPIANYETALLFAKNPYVTLQSQTQNFVGSHLTKANPLVFNQTKSEPVRYPNLEQLKFWWQQATQYEKDEFNVWLTNGQ